MSKAREWAATIRQHEIKRPEIKSSSAGVIARVSFYGGLDIVMDKLDAEDVLKLARWILETFGERDA